MVPFVEGRVGAFVGEADRFRFRFVFVERYTCSSQPKGVDLQLLQTLDGNCIGRGNQKLTV